MEEQPSSPLISHSFADTTDDPMNNLNSNNKDEFCGVNIQDLYHNKSPWNYYCPPLHPSKHHTVLFEVPANLRDVPKPHTSPRANVWDMNHVKMPFSPQNVFPTKENGTDVLKPRWDIIQCALLRPINNSYELEEAILSYNINLRRRKFHALHYLFENVFDEEETEAFFTNLLPKIINLALRLPELIKAPVPLLKQGKPHALSLSQVQITSLLANAFFCTFPWKKEHANYPGINFNGLYQCQIGLETTSEVLEKIKCILHYFRRVCLQEPRGVLTFERKHLPSKMFPRWDKLQKSVSNIKLHITSNGTIEEGGLGMLQVDFANCRIGGGVLYKGCVQEEIRFVICPELIVSLLFTEELAPNEALLMIGAECYSHYKGYAYSFEWDRNCNDETPYDDYGRKRTSIVAIDAIPYHNSRTQFSPSKYLREINKAYVGFWENPVNSNYPLAPVATGNWGCGAFGGNLHLKALIQIIACTAANRDLVYFTFGDKKLQYSIFNIYHYLATNNVTIAQLWIYLRKFVEANLPKHQLLPFIKQCHIDSVSEDKKNINKSASKQRNTSPVISTPRKTLKTDIPSTSKEVKDSPSQNSEDDIIEASQEDIDIPLTTFRSKNLTIPAKTSKTLPSPNKFKRIRDVSHLFYSSDEEETEAEKCTGFLSKLDAFDALKDKEAEKCTGFISKRDAFNALKDKETEKCTGFLSKLDAFDGFKDKSKSNETTMDVDPLLSSASDDSECLMEVVVDKKETIKTNIKVNDTESKKEVSKSRKSLITDYFFK